MSSNVVSVLVVFNFFQIILFCPNRPPAVLQGLSKVSSKSQKKCLNNQWAYGTNTGSENWCDSKEAAATAWTVASKNHCISQTSLNELFCLSPLSFIPAMLHCSLYFSLYTLLVANLTNTKWCGKPDKWLKPWHMGTPLRVLSKSYLMNTNMTGFIWFSKIFASLLLGRK